VLTQLDATHYRYFFHEDKAVVRPYSDALSPRQVTSQASLDLLFNRYKNSVYAVDYNIGRIVDAVRKSGRYDDTAIVVISDHGEGFELGRGRAHAGQRGHEARPARHAAPRHGARARETGSSPTATSSRRCSTTYRSKGSTRTCSSATPCGLLLRAARC
jgi:arylsulfatase A-like enzyme